MKPNKTENKMQTLFRITAKIALLVIIALYFTACVGDGGSSGPAAPAAAAPIAKAPVAPTPTPTAPTPTPAPQNVSLTYYRMFKTATPTIYGYATGPIVMEGACVIYKTKTYCWDDGPQGYADFVAGSTDYGPVYESYWNLGYDSSGNMGNCTLGCQNDPYTLPTLIDSFNGRIDQTAMFNVGQAVNVNCTESSGTLDCVDFSINLNQVVF